MINENCFILGYPSTGKTTFIAALWHTLKQKKTETCLTLKQFEGDQFYLSKIERQWLSGKEVSRTPIAAQNESLNFKLISKSGNEINFSFPDFSGELFDNIYLDRELNDELKDKICSSNNFVLFLNAAKVCDSVNISSLPKEIRQADDSDVASDIYSSIKHDTTAAKNIELLQFIDYIKQKKNVNLIVIISAWDLVNNEINAPDEFIEKYLPLLEQYLKSNSHIFKTKYYGISAQGIDLSIEMNSNLEGFLEGFEDNPIERIQVIDQNGVLSHDITLLLNNFIGE